VRDYREYKVWQKGHLVVRDVYRVTNGFPHTEQYGIASQLRRAAVSIPTNIAEGAGRESDADFRRFLQMAAGSANEVEYLLFLSGELDYSSSEVLSSVSEAVGEVRRMLVSLIQKL